MSRYTAWLRSKPFWVFVALVLVSFLVWWRGAMLAFGDAKPLGTDRAQFVLIAILGALYVLWLVVRWWRAKDINAKLLNRLAQPSHSTPRETPEGAEEVAELRARFQSAAEILKHAKLGGKEGGALSRFGGQYVYQLPWYIFVGSPGSGKTTALVNSGLQFPLAEQFGKVAIRGIGGTRHCDWWFTNEAVLIDTAGRYTTQDSSDVADKAEWAGFLELLRQFRPRQPINGVLLTVSVAELLSQDAADRLRHVSVLKQRLEELRSALGIQFPVYVLVTKVDLLAGFSEYFESISREERAQVWGFTFPYMPQPAQRFDFAARFRAEFDLLTRRLDAGLPELMLQKRDLQSRGLAYAFPQQFAGLEDLLEQFLAPLFAESKFRDAPLMRGVYFTSGTQEGTPFDRVLGALERRFNVQNRAAAPVARVEGKSYFLRNLLERVVFGESHLAGRDLRRERIQNTLRITGYACAALLLVGATLAWTGSYRKNTTYLADVAARVDALRDAASKQAPDDRPQSVTALLDATRDVGVPGTFDVHNPPIGWRFGLYQGAKVDAAANATYRQLLTDALLPRVARYTENSLRDALDRDDLGLVYRRLRAYLMLHDAQHYDAKVLASSLATDLAAEYDTQTAQRKDVRAALDRHLHGLFDAKPVASPYVEDASLVQNARERLARVSPAERVYKRIKAELVARSYPDFKLADNTGDRGAEVFRRASGDTELRGVPGIFTFNGYRDGFSKEADKLALSIGGEEAWVLGNAPSGDVAQRAASLRDRFDARLIRQVREMYMHEYVAEWKKFIDDIELRPMPTIADSIRVTKILSGPDSPLPVLVRAIVRETTLLPDQKPGSDSLIGNVSGAIVNRGKEIARSRTTVDLSGASGGDAQANRPERIVDAEFADLRRLVTQPAQGKPPIDDTLATLRSLSDYFVRLQSAREGNLTPPGTEPLVSARASTDPDPIHRMFLMIAAAGSSQAGDTTRSSLAASIAGEVGDSCHRRIDNRFPFFRDASTDVGIADFANLFRPNGVFDQYFQRNLADKVNMSTRPWTLKAGSGIASLPSLATFAQASEIRDAYFASGSGEPSFQVDMRAKSLDPAIKEIVIDMDGQTMSFSKDSPGPRTIRWPGAAGAHSIRLRVLPEGVVPAIEASGPWALHRLFRRAKIARTGRPEAFSATFDLGGRMAEFEVIGQGVANPLDLTALERFRCPGRP